MCAAFLLWASFYLQQKFCLGSNRFFFLPKGCFFLANKYRSPCLVCFYEGLKWCIPGRETLQAVTALCPSASPLKSNSVSCGIHLGLLLLLLGLHGSHPSQSKQHSPGASEVLEMPIKVVTQFSLFPSCSSSHTLLPALLRGSVAVPKLPKQVKNRVFTCAMGKGLH